VSGGSKILKEKVAIVIIYKWHGTMIGILPNLGNIPDLIR
jgi:hypothetical protein